MKNCDLDTKITFLDKKTGELSFVNTSDKNSLNPWKGQKQLTNDQKQNLNISML